jgi:hypothetical protein
MMILFQTILNDESGLSETSVATRTSEHWKVINLTTCTERNIFIQFWFIFENKI